MAFILKFGICTSSYTKKSLYKVALSHTIRTSQKTAADSQNIAKKKRKTKDRLP